MIRVYLSLRPSDNTGQNIQQHALKYIYTSPQRYSRQRRKRDHGSSGTDSRRGDNAALKPERVRMRKRRLRVTRVYTLVYVDLLINVW